MKNYELGDVLCDMHDGLHLPDGAEVVTSITVDTHGRTCGTDTGSEFITRMLRVRGIENPSRGNKQLVIVDVEVQTGHVIAACSYDGRSLMLATIKGLT
jgi:hypothetical protein